MALSFLFGDRDRAATFRPIRPHKVGSRTYHLHVRAQATLGQGNLHDAVKLPEGEDEDEWLAMWTVDFYNDVNRLYALVAEFCTDTSCPVMSSGSKSCPCEYAWADGKTIIKPIKVSAPKYVDFLMAWVQGQLDDEALFPTQPQVPFPPHFKPSLQQIFKRLFRVFAHIYYCHFESIEAIGAQPHLNTCFKHFMYFVLEFDLITNKQELAPLQQLIDKLLERDAMRYGLNLQQAPPPPAPPLTPPQRQLTPQQQKLRAAPLQQQAQILSNPAAGAGAAASRSLCGPTATPASVSALFRSH